MEIREVQIVQAMVKSKLPDCDYVINPYIGCAHSCAYCYAKFMKRFTGHHQEWGKFIDVKTNIVWALKNQLERSARTSYFEKGIVFLSSVTDPYQPLEKKYRLTRSCLELLAWYDWPVSILSKSSLITRDIDIFKNFSDIEVGLSIGVLNDETARLFEPTSNKVSERVKALHEVKRNGIKNYLFIAPVLPYLTDLESTFKFFHGKVDKICVETLNTDSVNWKGVREVLTAHFPELLPKYEDIFFTKKRDAYLEDLSREVSALGKKYKVKTVFYSH